MFFCIMFSSVDAALFQVAYIVLICMRFCIGLQIV